MLVLQGKVNFKASTKAELTFNFKELRSAFELEACLFCDWQNRDLLFALGTPLVHYVNTARPKILHTTPYPSNASFRDSLSMLVQK